jgi:hypothetical protein
MQIDTTTSAPDAAAGPSARTLLRSTLIALSVATFILVTIVLPAEYGVDPTGIGRALGLTRMGEIKMALAREVAGAEAAERAARASGATTAAEPAEPPTALPVVSPTVASTTRSDTVSVTLQPGQGAEYKLAMKRDARATFAWSVANGVVNYDVHADAPGIRYHGYEKGQAKGFAEGTLVAAFDGMHGWFWRNRGSTPVTVTLRTAGEYQEIKRIE